MKGGPIVLSVYPGCGEASAVFMPGAGVTGAGTDRAKRPERRPELGGTVLGLMPDEDTSHTGSTANRARADRRAKTRARRYVVANRCTFMRTLTYGPPYCFDRAQAGQDVGRMRQRLLRAGHELGPYLYVPEVHQDGERLHLHLLSSRPWAEVCERCATPELRARRGKRFGPLPPAGVPCFGCAWRHGFVGLNPGYQDDENDPRKAAAYGLKYIGKEMALAPAGSQTYGVGQGFQPERVQVLADDWDQALGLATVHFGGEVPETAWSSMDHPTWEGPPGHVLDVASGRGRRSGERSERSRPLLLHLLTVTPPLYPSLLGT